MNGTSDMQGFLPDDYIDRKSQVRTNILWALIFVIVAAGIGAAWFIAQKKVNEVETANRQVTEQFAAATKTIETFQLRREAQEALQKKADIAHSLSERVNRSNLLAELANNLPKGVTLADMSLEGVRKSGESAKAAMTALERSITRGSATVSTAQPILYDVTIHITGLANTDSQVIEYANALKACPAGAATFFKEVTFVRSSETLVGERKMRSFEMNLIMEPMADSHGLRATAPKIKAASR